MFDQNNKLIERAKNGDRQATETLFSLNMGLVKKIALKFLNRGIELDDAIQIGCIGLQKAIQKFDFSYDVQFSTYAVPMIMGEIKRFLRDDGIIKVSRSLKESQWKIKKMVEVLGHEIGREPTVEELADKLSMEPEEIILCMEAVVEVDSMEQSIYGKDGKEISLKDKLAAEKNEQEELMNRLFLQQLLNSLEERDKQLILLRYFENKTQTEVAEILGISQVQVSRLEKRILRRLKELA